MWLVVLESGKGTFVVFGALVVVVAGDVVVEAAFVFVFVFIFAVAVAVFLFAATSFH